MAEPTIAEQLRDDADLFVDAGFDPSTMLAAADELERLHARCAALEEVRNKAIRVGVWCDGYRALTSSRRTRLHELNAALAGLTEPEQEKR
jgi:hypothetical protein